MTLMSEATLVMQTRNSIYTLEIGGDWNRLTCVEGTLHGQVDREMVTELDAEILREWRWATGHANAASIPSLKRANLMANYHVVGRPWSFHTARGKYADITEVIDAYWTYSYVPKTPEHQR